MAWSINTRRQRRVKTPTVIQMETVECGAAVLGIILEYYGRIVPLAQLRQECGVSRDGSSAANIMRLARAYGLTVKAFKKTLPEVQELRCPYIIFWHFDHFLVVEGFHKGRVYVNDPATGPRTVTLEAFDEAFTGVVLVMQPGPHFTSGGRHPSMLQALSTRLRGSRHALVYCFLAGLLLACPSLALPVFTQIFVDIIVLQGTQDWLLPLLLGMLLTVALHGVLQGLQLQHLSRLQRKLATVMGSRFLWHLLHLPGSFYAQRYAGEVAQRTLLNDKIAMVLSGRLATTLIDVVMVLAYVVVMAYYDLVLSAIGVGFAAINVLTLQWVARRQGDANRQWLQEVGQAGGVALAGLQNIEMLKATALESDFFGRWAGYYARAINAQQALSVTQQTLSVLPTLLAALASMLVLGIGGWRVMQGHLSIGMLVAFQSLMHRFLAPITNLVNLGGTMQELRGDLQRLDDVLGYPTASRGATQASAAPLTAETFRLRGALEVRHVTFGYSRFAAPVLTDVSFSLRPGQRLVLVGASGSGKSTLARLLCGLYGPWEGEILFDGVPLQHIPPAVLAQSIAMVDQDLVFFAGTVRDNLTLWDRTVTDSMMRQACQDAVIHDTLVALPGGYNGALLEGAANLSGGQRQRLEIARALIYNPVLLVLDEATNALDADTEYRLVRHLHRRACSCIIVAHRLSTIRDCDEILVLDQGQIVQRGTHANLVREKGLYLHLLRSEGAVLDGRML